MASREEFEAKMQRHSLRLEQLRIERERAASEREWRSMFASIAEEREHSRRHSEALLAAQADLRAEIRSWGGGARY
jgi:hypothetical protein